MHEVADQLSSLRSIERQQVQQAHAQAAAQAAHEIAAQRFKAGLGDYLVVLNTEAPLLLELKRAADLKARALDTQISLIRSLGGGYLADPELATHLAANPKGPS